MLYLELSARENLLFSARMHGLADPAERTREMLGRIGLESHSNLPARLLSKGMRQRLSIARALVHEPRIVVFDEPFSGLDQAGREWLEAWLWELKGEHRAVLFTSHDVPACQRLADDVLELRSSRLQARPPHPSRSATAA
jgi:ABC-type multidrug transport system ATPase subunit